MARRDRDRRHGGGRDRWEQDGWQAERREQRRQEDRRAARRGRAPGPAAQPDPRPAFTRPEPAALAPVCGNCREWFSHETGGRGACDHPGSGFTAPWSDTAACQFFLPRR